MKTNVVHILSLGLSVGALTAAEPGFEPLLTGSDMSPFVLVGTPAETWAVKGDTIRCTGSPKGYISTREHYRNFVLKFDFRFERPADLVDDSTFTGNSGVLLFLGDGEREVWPSCLQVQGKHVEAGKILTVAGAATVAIKDDPEARKRVLRPVGQWNSLEITVREGAVTSLLNGVLVASSEPGELREGSIGFQSEGAPLEFRALQIKRLP